MACKYTYKGKTYEAHEFDDVLRAMPPSVAAKYMPGVQSVPEGPFVKDTKAWVALAVKRIMLLAAQGNYDKVAFVTGEQSADRYSLAKQVDAIMWERESDGLITFTPEKDGQDFTAPQTVAADKLDEYLGKEIADKIVNSTEDNGYLEGVDLEVGGEGMKSFYNRIVPQVVGDVLKKLGGKVETVEIARPNASRRDEILAELEAEDGKPRQRTSRLSQLGFTVTPEMREKLKGDGLPLFSKKRGSDVQSTQAFDIKRIDNGQDKRNGRDGFWGRLSAGDAFSTAQLASAYAGSLNRPVAAEYRGRNGGESTFEWPGELAGFKGYYTLAGNDPDGAFTMLVIPKELLPSLDGLTTAKLADTTIVAYTAQMNLNDGRLHISIAEANPGTAAYAALEKKGRIEKLSNTTADGAHSYSRIDIGTGMSYRLLRELARRYGVAHGDIPDVYFSRDTGATAGSSRSYTSNEVKSKLSPQRRNVFGVVAPLATWSTPDMTRIDDVIYQMQDKHIDTRRVVEAVKARAGQIADQWNPYLQEELFHGRSAKQTKDFLSNELRPLLQDLQARDVTIADFEEFLQNRHAEERNKQIAKINAAMPDAGSGISTQDARDYLANLPAAKARAMNALAARVDQISKETRDLLVREGVESADTIAAWEGAYKYYVPLMREDIDYGSSNSGMGTGQGYSVRGSSSKRATGSTRDVVDILANLAMQRERAIVRAEKNRVAKSVYGMAVQNPNTSFWLAVNPSAATDKAGLINELVAMGMNVLDARNVIEEPTQPVVDPRTGLVSYRINPLLRTSPNVLAVRVDGTERYVFFNQNDARSERMVSALKNLDADQLGRVMGMMSKVTRYFASVNTQYNPIFGVINFMRDVQGALLNLSTTKLAGSQKEVMANVIPALRGLYADIRAERKGNTRPQGTWAQLWEEFQREGGQTGYRDMFSRSAERAEALERELAQISEGKVKQAGRAVFDWLSDYNETMENAVRLSSYKAALDNGMTKQQAASIAKNLTVNFNRKGQVATQAGALYAFFNAAVQGTARLSETMTGPMGKKILAGGLILGTMQALLLDAAGFGEDEPPEFVRERNLVIPTFGLVGKKGYLTVPLPLGYHVIPNTSRVLTEFALSGFKNPTKRVGQIFGAFLDSFNPIGNAGWSVQTIAPTVVDPLIALGENRDWTGKQIAKKDRSDNEPTPGYTRAKDTASWFSKQLSYYLNLASGGTKYKQGMLSPTPDQLDYLIGQVTGGVGREILKVEQTASSLATGEELPTHKIPLVGRFYGDAESKSAESGKFYANVKKLNEHEAEIKGRRENREPLGDYVKDNPEARLIDAGNSAEKDVNGLRKRKRELLEKGASRESVRIIETQIANRMKRLNDMVLRAEQ